MSQEIITRLVYPDPFKPVGLEFELDQKSIVTVTLIRQNGAVIKILVEEKAYEKGRHSISFPVPTDFGHDIFCRVLAETAESTTVETRKIQ